MLARHLAAPSRAAAGRDDGLFTPEALAMLEQHTWPGNVRELANVIEHALILCDGAAVAQSICRSGSPLRCPRRRLVRRRLR